MSSSPDRPATPALLLLRRPGALLPAARTGTAAALTACLVAALSAAPVGAETLDRPASARVAAVAGSQDLSTDPDPCAPGLPGVVRGTPGADVLKGGAGDDVLCGLGGDDVLRGGAGDDQLHGGAGTDTLEGGAGTDVHVGGPGADSVRGGDGDDIAFGEDGDDLLEGGTGEDLLQGGPGRDRVVGGSDDDNLAGDDGDDVVVGQDGDDALHGGEGVDTADGQDGTDTCTAAETRTRCEADADAAPRFPLAGPLSVPSAPAGEVVVDGVVPGFRVSIDSAGGIRAADVRVGPARELMGGRVGRELLASAAFRIDVPASAPPFRSATLTIPYQAGLLGDFPAEDLRMFTFDEETGFWVPAPGEHVVDTAARTITATVEHFSVYAALKVATSEDWEALFGQTPVRCVATSDTVLDAAMVIDTSGSMSGNDPGGLRVDAAKQFVASMRDTDRASVITFSSSTTTRLPLTTLDAPASRAAVDEALETGRLASGGTDIPGAVSRATQVLSETSGQRLRAAFLLTDGYSSYSYSDSLTDAARDAGVVVYTIGLGSSVDTALLGSIAAGTGGEFIQLSDASQLVPLYERLVGDIIDDGTNSDGDSISDCVERNGAFVPEGLAVGPFDGGTSDADPLFVTTRPDLTDTDGDERDDDEELVRKEFADYPYLEEEFGFLVDQGLTYFFTLESDPTDPDTDGDTLDDFQEWFNGTDPKWDDYGALGTTYGIAGLDLPPYTLFQPERYDYRPAVEAHVVVDDGYYEPRVFGRLVVRFDADGDCVETCSELYDAAELRPDDNGWGICFNGWGDCVTDEGQVRDIVAEVRAAQGVFDEDGHVQQHFAATQVAGVCADWSDGSPACAVDDASMPSDLEAPDLVPAVSARIQRAIPSPGGTGGVRVGPGHSTAVAERVVQTGTALELVAGTVVAVAGVQAVQQAVEECFAGPVLRLFSRITVFEHPCQSRAVFSPGTDVDEATRHDADAIAADPSRAALSYASTAERSARSFGPQWYNATPQCNSAARAAAARPGVVLACDELPFASTQQAGPGASLRLIDQVDNTGEGLALFAFYRSCPRLTVAPAAGAVRERFVVAPNLAASRTIGYCSR